MSRDTGLQLTVERAKSRYGNSPDGDLIYVHGLARGGQPMQPMTEDEARRLIMHLQSVLGLVDESGDEPSVFSTKDGLSFQEMIDRAKANRGVTGPQETQSWEIGQEMEEERPMSSIKVTRYENSIAIWNQRASTHNALHLDLEQAKDLGLILYDMFKPPSSDVLPNYAEADAEATARLAAFQVMEERDESPEWDPVSTEEIIDVLKGLSGVVRVCSPRSVHLLAQARTTIGVLELELAEEELEVADAELDELAVRAKQLEEASIAAARVTHDWEYDYEGGYGEEGEPCCPHTNDCAMHHLGEDLTSGSCDCEAGGAELAREAAEKSRRPQCPHSQNCGIYDPAFPGDGCDCGAEGKTLTADEAAVIERMAENAADSRKAKELIFGPTVARRSPLEGGNSDTQEVPKGPSVKNHVKDEDCWMCGDVIIHTHESGRDYRSVPRCMTGAGIPQDVTSGLTLSAEEMRQAHKKQADSGCSDLGPGC